MASAAPSPDNVLLSLDVKRKVLSLIGIQGQYTSLRSQYQEEVLELNRKYLKLSDPLFQRRTQIVSGSVQPTAQEIRAGETEYKKDHPEYTPLPSLESEGASRDGISGFWLITLKKNTAMTILITERDEAALMHLTDVSFDCLQGSEHGFKLIFTFSKNDFFTNDHLTKIYYYENRASGLIDHTVGCEIMWKNGKDLTHETRLKTRKNGSVTYTVVPVKSFFDFFSPPLPPTEDDIESGRMDKHKFVALEDRLETDYRVAKDLVGEIIPCAIDYFIGKNTLYSQIEKVEPEDAVVLPNVFFDIAVNGEPLGRIICELWDDVAPMAARNFRRMATGELGIGYKGSKFYAVQKDFLIAGGVKGSTFSKSFKLEQTNLQNYKPGLLTMVSDNNDGYVGSYFYIVIGSSGKWDNAFGEVTQGLDLVRRINSLGSNNFSSKVDYWFYPKDVFAVSDCGLVA